MAKKFHDPLCLGHVAIVYRAHKVEGSRGSHSDKHFCHSLGRVHGNIASTSVDLNDQISTLQSLRHLCRVRIARTY